MHFDVILAMRAEKLHVLTLPGADNKPTQLFVLKRFYVMACIFLQIPNDYYYFPF